MQAAILGVTSLCLAGTAQAQFSEERVREQLFAQGYEHIEISEDGGTIHVGAERGKIRLHSTYDKVTGEHLADRFSQRGKDGASDEPLR
ncbi:hypothetical protein SAMN05421538_101340 [Paracoccus isoporae]|uniref:Peptidase propeptide and YPEB domain-containing protein n=1 Tax=Paracoccus isoporae TaxID=591205 RepID=A0A1G6TQK6_9RHOB|nr:hypothetical protein [Paracoccus isoporae]SDD31174.1 hypothetical protein SAMN05421538_101340 [Paracoccus isoporae]